MKKRNFTRISATLTAAALVGSAMILAPTAAQAVMDEPELAPAGSDVWNQVRPDRVAADTEAGDIKWIQSRTDAPVGSEGWTVIYATEVQPGELKYVSGEIYVPTAPSETPRDIVLWNHETVGNADVCAPSRNTLSNRVPAIDALLGAGNIVVMSDYPGLAMSGPSYYMSGQPNARASLDIARAAVNLPSLNASNKVAMYGWSQGGQTSMWASQLASEYAPELEIVGAGLIAPATNILDLTLNSMTETFLAGYVISTLPGIKAAYPDLRYEEFLTPEGLAQFPAIADGCFDIWRSAAGVEDPYLPGAMDAGSPWYDAMLDAQTYDWQSFSTVPMYTIQGTDDDTVPAAQAFGDHESMCAAGFASTYHSVEGGTHGSVLRETAEIIPGWFADRFSGVPAENNCPEDEKPEEPGGEPSEPGDASSSGGGADTGADGETTNDGSGTMTDETGLAGMLSNTGASGPLMAGTAALALAMILAGAVAIRTHRRNHHLE